MKRIGIMSMQRVRNYGSFLQAYGLRKTIEELGNYEVVFVDFLPGESLIKEKNKKFRRKILNLIHLKTYIKKKKYERQFNDLYDNVYLKELRINDEYNYKEQVDQLVIGSDEVFNCLQRGNVGFSKSLFGQDHKDIPVISYAASFGYVTYEMLRKYELQKELTEYFADFAAISVRDNNSLNVLENLGIKDVNINLDPVLVTEFDSTQDKEIPFDNYIIVYAYAGRLEKDEEKAIKKFAKRHNKKIISVGTFQKIADMNIVIDPTEIFKYFKKADFVITDTFHGSIFSIKAHTKFCTIIRQSNKNKLLDLLERVKLQSRVIYSIENLENMYTTSVDFEKTDRIITNERMNTINYLKENLIDDK